MTDQPRDLLGRAFEVGQRVVRGETQFNYLRVCEVTRVDGLKVYLDGSSRPMKHLDRLAIVA